jgi:hypothetical protein
VIRILSGGCGAQRLIYPTPPHRQFGIIIS